MTRTLFRTRIKFCGMTRAGDIRLAGELGVDAVGFIFARESKRRVTPAEARVACALVRGLSPQEAADACGVALGTVRTQLKAVFAKTRTRRQAELVRLLIGLSPA